MSGADVDTDTGRFAAGGGFSAGGVFRSRQVHIVGRAEMDVLPVNSRTNDVQVPAADVITCCIFFAGGGNADVTAGSYLAGRGSSCLGVGFASFLARTQADADRQAAIFLGAAVGIFAAAQIVRRFDGLIVVERF